MEIPLSVDLLQCYFKEGLQTNILSGQQHSHFQYKFYFQQLQRKVLVC
jgi:hypothetical protein